MIYSHMTARKVSIILVLPGFRKFAKTALGPYLCSKTSLYVPDINMDAMKFMQVLADGQLLADPPRDYKAFNFTIEYEYNLVQ